MQTLQEILMPTSVTLPDALVKKMQTVAVPLQDTHVSVIERGIDALIEKMSGSTKVPPDAFAAAKPSVATDGHVMYSADAPPSLTFTKPLAIVLDGDALPKNELYWNLLLFRVVAKAAKKLDKAALQKALLVN